MAMATLNFQAEEQFRVKLGPLEGHVAWRLEIDYCMLKTDMPLTS
jgi:hypothetical protein